MQHGSDSIMAVISLYGVSSLNYIVSCIYKVLWSGKLDQSKYKKKKDLGVTVNKWSSECNESQK